MNKQTLERVQRNIIEELEVENEKVKSELQILNNVAQKLLLTGKTNCSIEVNYTYISFGVREESGCIVSSNTIYRKDSIFKKENEKEEFDLSWFSSRVKITEEYENSNYIDLLIELGHLCVLYKSGKIFSILTDLFQKYDEISKKYDELASQIYNINIELNKIEVKEKEKRIEENIKVGNSFTVNKFKRGRLHSVKKVIIERITEKQIWFQEETKTNINRIGKEEFKNLCKNNIYIFIEGK